MINLIENFNQNWHFLIGEYISCASDQLNETKLVDIPHTAIELPYNYFDEKVYQKKFTYLKKLYWTESFENKNIWLEFEGAMANSHVYVNGILVKVHPDGYTPFDVLLTPHLKKR